MDLVSGDELPHAQLESDEEDQKQQDNALLEGYADSVYDEADSDDLCFSAAGKHGTAQALDEKGNDVEPDEVLRHRLRPDAEDGLLWNIHMDHAGDGHVNESIDPYVDQSSQ